MGDALSQIIMGTMSGFPVNSTAAFNPDPAATALLLEWTPSLTPRGSFDPNWGMIFAAVAFNPNPAVAQVPLEVLLSTRDLAPYLGTPYPGQTEEMREKQWKERVISTVLLHAASLNPDPAMVEFLLDQGGDINTDTLNSALASAAWRNPNPAITELILDRGADVNFKDEEFSHGYTPLHFAALHNPNPMIAAVLIDRGADTERSDNKHRATPLVLAVLWGEAPGMVKTLLDGGADPDARATWLNPSGHALHAAVLVNNSEAVIALLDAGADAKIPNDGGDTPCRLARYEGHFADTPLLIRLCRP